MSTELAFVAGATGYTGRSVVRELRARGVITVAHVRRESREYERWAKAFRELGAEIDSTPWGTGELGKRLGRLAPTHVFALVGTTWARARREARDAVGPRPSYATVDVALTTELVEAVRPLAPRPRFVFLSSIGTAPGKSNPYRATRWQIEETLRGALDDWTIVRPSFITGPDREERRLGETLGAATFDTLLALAPARLRDRYRSITGPELARALVRLGFDPTARGRVVYAEDLR
ncbi:MAG: NAD-dependent epimerase/dehydratase family protein [Planctomycetes bacterium]|nr:NAD-dependent epimerase/dehydratase family protein [Planctomycetota bacterium]